MAFSREVRVNVVGDTKSLERAFARSSSASRKFGRDVDRNLGGVDRTLAGLSRTKIFVGGFVGSAAILGLRRAVTAASDLAEQGSKVEQVFGRDSATGIEAWAKTTANAFGVSERAALTAAGTFGNLFNTVGLAPQKSAAMSRSLVQLAADLASFNNSDPSEVLDALRSGLIGEAEPLRRFGVLLSEARVQQEAMRETGKTTAASLTDQEKALARYNLILKDTAPAQGDFARTSDGAANSSRRLSANLEDLQANLASGLVPALAKVTGGLADMTAAMRTASITADDLVNNKGLRDKFADAFGVDELFKTLNKITSAGLRTRPDEGASRAGSKAGKETGSAIGDAFSSALERAIKSAKGQVATAITKGQAAIDKEAADAAAQAARDKQRAGFETLIDTIGLRIDRDVANNAFGKALADNTALQNAIKRQIRVEGQTVELERKLFDARQARAALIKDRGAETQAAERKAAEALRARDQARQFRALGLSGTGDEPVPGIKNLAKRINQTLRNADLGKVDISSKLVSRLKAARKLIKAEGENLKEDTRRAINDFLKAATGQDNKTKTNGPLTKTSALNANRILEGLGLTRDMERELRSRLSGINSAGFSLGGKPTATTGGFTGAPVVVESHTTVTLDGDVVGRNVTRSQQKAVRRNPPQRRGPNAR